MTSQVRKQATAGSVGDRSCAIVVSFGYEWYAKLRNRTFSAVIRKRVPSTSKPTLLYFHINRPKSAICARASVLSVARVSKRQAVALATELDLSTISIEQYVGDHDSIGLFRIGNIELPEDEITTTALQSTLVYYPPQSFFVLSRDGKSVIDSMCRFQKSDGSDLPKRLIHEGQ